MICIIYLSFVLLTVSQYVAGGPVPGFVYRREVDSWLRLHTIPANWLDASARCQLEGGSLASPTTTPDLSQTMRDIMKEHKLGSGSSVHTGFAVHLGGGASNTGDMFCMALTSAGAQVEVSCESALPYFCYKAGTHKCGPKDNGYEWEPRTGSCYKFHRAALQWRHALSACHAEGGHLAVIESETEASALEDICAKNPANTITGTDHKDFVFIGFRKWDDDEWATIYGNTLSDIGFAKWARGEPNNTPAPENCGSIDWNAQLNDVPCTRKYPYVCEITP